MPTVSNVDALCEQARALMKQRRIAEARQQFEQAVELDPRNIPALEGAAATAFAEKDFERAAAHYKKLTLVDVRRIQPSVNLGAVYNRMGDYNAALKVLRSAVAKDKKCASAYYNMGIAHKGLNQLSMAVTAYKEAVRLDPKMVDASFNLGNILLEMGSYQQAVVYFEKALETDPSFEKARRGLQRAHDARDESRKSQAAFGRLVDEGTAARNQQEHEYRLLTPKERLEDRTALHQLAQDVETLAAALLKQLHDDLGPALQKFQHRASVGDGRHAFDEAEALQSATDRLRTSSALFEHRLSALRDHERQMQD
jgi:tetratricopeptide (TPR) repeat protein